MAAERCVCINACDGWSWLGWVDASAPCAALVVSLTCARVRGLLMTAAVAGIVL